MSTIKKTKITEKPSILKSLGLSTNRVPQPKRAKVSDQDRRILEISKLNESQGSRELLSAARSGDLGRVCYLTSLSSVEINYASTASEDGLGRGGTALHFASYNGFAEVVNELLKRGADPSLLNSKGETLLHIAARRGAVAVVKVLSTEFVDWGPLRAVKDNLGRTALWYAINGTTQQHKEIAKIMGFSKK